MSTSFLQEYAPKLKDIVFDRLLESAGEAMKTEQKGNYVDIVQYLQKILAGTPSRSKQKRIWLLFVEVSTDERVSEMFEHFNLKYGFKCFQEDNLAKRLRGTQFELL